MPTATCPHCGWYLSANERLRLIYCERCGFEQTFDERKRELARKRRREHMRKDADA